MVPPVTALRNRQRHQVDASGHLGRTIEAYLRILAKAILMDESAYLMMGVNSGQGFDVVAHRGQRLPGTLAATTLFHSVRGARTR